MTSKEVTVADKRLGKKGKHSVLLQTALKHLEGPTGTSWQMTIANQGVPNLPLILETVREAEIFREERD